jgi:hypothetical protein
MLLWLCHNPFKDFAHKPPPQTGVGIKTKKIEIKRMKT